MRYRRVETPPTLIKRRILSQEETPDITKKYSYVILGLLYYRRYFI